jgi:predicted NACHT family NTPase
MHPAIVASSSARAAWVAPQPGPAARPACDPDIAMPQRFESNTFSPDANKLMREAFEVAWLKATLIEGDRELTRQLLASAIIDQVVAGALDRDQIAAAALAILAVAKNVSS